MLDITGRLLAPGDPIVVHADGTAIGGDHYGVAVEIIDAHTGPDPKPMDYARVRWTHTIKNGVRTDHQQTDPPETAEINGTRMRKVLPHIHVGQNAPGTLPEDGPFCFDDPDEATDFLTGQLKDLAEEYYDRCPDGAPDECEDPWCDLARTVYGDHLPHGALGPAVRDRHTWGAVYSTPEGPDWAVWAAPAPGLTVTCDLADQN